MSSGPQKLIYKTFREHSKDLWICTLCTNFRIQNAAGKYPVTSTAARRRAMEADADTHIANTHKDCTRKDHP